MLLPPRCSLHEAPCHPPPALTRLPNSLPPPTQHALQLADYFIRWWTRDHYNKYGQDCIDRGDEPCGPMFYVQWYGVLGLAFFIGLMFFRGWALYAWCNGSSQRQHAKSIHRVLYAPLGFFLTTPVGDLLVSFTKDQDIMDDALPDALYYAGIYGLILLATTITVSVTIPLFSAMAGALFALSGIMLAVYLPAATHLKKLRMGTAGEGRRWSCWRWCRAAAGCAAWALPPCLCFTHPLPSPSGSLLPPCRRRGDPDCRGPGRPGRHPGLQ